MSAPPPAVSDRPEPRPTVPGVSSPAGNSGRRSPLTRLLAYRRFWALGLLVFFLDQFTKHLIYTRLPLGSYGPTGIPVFPGFFNLVHLGNTGAAWSMFTGRSTALALLACGTLVAIFLGRRALGLRHPSAQAAFGLLCGGIIGNLVDRLNHHHVIDFIDLHFGSYVYPTFNVADSGICIGVFWYILWSIRQPPYGENSSGQPGAN